MTERSFSHPDDPNNNFVRLNMKSNTRQHTKVWIFAEETNISSYLHTYKGITRSTSPWNNGNLLLPFFGGNYSIVLLDNIY